MRETPLRDTPDRRGQAHSLEGLSAALVVLLALFFALQITTTTPSTASTASKYLGKEAQNGAVGVLKTADVEDELRGTLLYWNDSTNSFHDVGGLGYYTDRGPPTPFGDRLEATLGHRRIAYNVNLHYRDGAGGRAHRRLVYSGHPNEDAVTASRVVTLYDRDRLRGPDGDRTADRIGNASFFAPDAAPNSTLYNVVEVEVVLWRS